MLGLMGCEVLKIRRERREFKGKQAWAEHYAAYQERLRNPKPQPSGQPPMTKTEATQEPFYIRQSGDEMTDEEASLWFIAAAKEALEEGATFCRASYHSDIPHLRIMEAWKERPDDQGEIRWALTLANEMQSGVPKRPRPLADVPPSQAVCSASPSPAGRQAH